jgi:hypothetical protein
MYNYLLMFCNRIQSKEGSAQPFCVVREDFEIVNFIWGMNGALVWRRRLTRPTLRWGTLSLLLRRKEGLEDWLVVLLVRFSK